MEKRDINKILALLFDIKNRLKLIEKELKENAKDNKDIQL
jgi:hypothetical protein